VALDEPVDTDDLTDASWANLVGQIRPYLLEGAELNRDLDLRRQVTGIIAQFRDTETDTSEWLSQVSQLLLTVIPPADETKEDRLLDAFASALPYLQTAREQEPPLLAVGRERLREVHRKAVGLDDAISSFLKDPWVGVVIQTESMVTGAEWKSKQDAASPETEVPLAEARPRPTEKEALLLMIDAAETRNFYLSPLCTILSSALGTVSELSEITSAGVEWLEGLQARGRPPEAGARLPALVIALITRNFAPAPPRGGGVRRWREAIADFVCGVLAEAGLPSVTREFLEDSLK
jgi:hypothetical protein